MSAFSNRTRRADNAPTVLLQGRVAPTTRTAVQLAAERSGVSIAYYLDTFLQDFIVENGDLPLVRAARDKAEQLDIPEEATSTAA